MVSVALLMPGLVAGLQVDDLALEAAALGPAQVHPEQHLGPVLGLGAAGAGMDGDDRVLPIVLAAEHLLDFAGVDLSGQLVEGAAEIVGDGLSRFGPFDEHGEIVDPTAAASRLSSVSSSRRRRRCSSFCAVAWSFQKSGAATRSSIFASSSAGRAASKMAPQVAGAPRQVLVPAKLIVEL